MASYNLKSILIAVFVSFSCAKAFAQVDSLAHTFVKRHLMDELTDIFEDQKAILHRDIEFTDRLFSAQTLKHNLLIEGNESPVSLALTQVSEDLYSILIQNYISDVDVKNLRIVPGSGIELSPTPLMTSFGFTKLKLLTGAIETIYLQKSGALGSNHSVESRIYFAIYLLEGEHAIAIAFPIRTTQSKPATNFIESVQGLSGSDLDLYSEEIVTQVVETNVNRALDRIKAQ